jgi:RNA polymerase sigma-70 factor (ECF subfamily)
VNTKTPRQHTDQQLVDKILGGDMSAFMQVIHETENLVAHLAFKMIPVAADRKDIAQEVYLKAYHSLPNFRFQSKLSTWIGQITYNTCLHYLQKKKPVLLECFLEKNDNDIENLANGFTENEAETRLLARELNESMSRAIQQLPALQQMLIGLFYHQELSLAEISGITNLPEGTLKSHLFRARQQLKQILLRMQKREEI